MKVKVQKEELSQQPHKNIAWSHLGLQTELLLSAVTNHDDNALNFQNFQNFQGFILFKKRLLRLSKCSATNYVTPLISTLRTSTEQHRFVC